MYVNPALPAGTSLHDRVVYFFCSPGCKKMFDQDSGRYVREGMQAGFSKHVKNDPTPEHTERGEE
jgi:hypothetical protein